MKTVILKVEGMSCSACQNRVEKYLNRQDGVLATVNLVMAQAFIKYDEKKVTLSDLERFIEESGYKSAGIYDGIEKNKNDYSKNYLILYAILIFILMYISMSHMLHLPIVSFLDMNKYPVCYGVALFLLTVPFILFGLDIIRSGIIKLIYRNPNMDTLVTVGVLASFIYSLGNLFLLIFGNNKMVGQLYFESCAMIIYFLKLGRFIDKKSKEKTKEAIKELVQITPQVALIKVGKNIKTVTIDEVKKDDIVICKNGMKVAVDGTIVSGEAYLDEAFLTGESIPKKKRVNDVVMAGTINIDGYIEYKAEKIGPDSTISGIVKLVLEAANSKAPIQRISDVVSGYFVPGIIIIAILTFFIYLFLGKSISDSIISFVTVLVVACPCALGLATPLAVIVSIGNSAREGIFIKSSEILENACKVDVVIFDKTGTLTYGNLRISRIYNYSKYSDKELLSVVSNLESFSNHPISRAFKDSMDKKMNVGGFKELPGIGIFGVVNKKEIYLGNNKIFGKLKLINQYEVEEEKLKSEGNSIVYVIENKKVIGLIGVKDIVRENVKETICKLKRMNKEIIVLSGDNEETANIIAKQLGIEKVIANVLPSEKEKILKKIMSDNHKVMMVGDGINDAPSIASADIGVSINSGTDIALDSADVILMNDDLSKLIVLFNISRKTIRIVKQNLFWAFIYNILMIPIAIGVLKPLGISLSPVFASISMTVSSLTVVFNSLRLRNANK